MRGQATMAKKYEPETVIEARSFTSSLSSRRTRIFESRWVLWVRFVVLAASLVAWLRVSRAVWYAREAARSGGKVAWAARCAKPVGRNRSCTADGSSRVQALVGDCVAVGVRDAGDQAASAESPRS
jgi:hypothetical protein